MKNQQTTSNKLEEVLKIESERFSKDDSPLNRLKSNPFLKEILDKKTEYTFPQMDTVGRLAFQSSSKGK
jgi:hypothetical protein